VPCDQHRNHDGVEPIAAGLDLVPPVRSIGKLETTVRLRHRSGQLFPATKLPQDHANTLHRFVAVRRSESVDHAGDGSDSELNATSDHDLERRTSEVTRVEIIPGVAVYAAAHQEPASNERHRSYERRRVEPVR